MVEGGGGEANVAVVMVVLFVAMPAEVVLAPVMDVVVLVVGHAPSPGRQSVGPMQTLPSLTVGMSTV